MQENIQVILSEKNLDPERVRQWVALDTTGAQVLFVGTVRNHSGSKSIEKLEFSAYDPMAIKEMEKIAFMAIKQYELTRVAIHHRKGTLGIGEIPVVIAVSAPHRERCFDACSYIIDMLKQTVPIWKKEFSEDGSIWVSATP